MPSYIYIHGKFYDLDEIKKTHPGGYLKIFESLKNEEDCTPLFESCHAMKDIDRIKEMLKNYEIKEADYESYNITDSVAKSKNELKKFTFDNYHALSREVKKLLRNDHKVNSFWYFKLAVFTSLYIFTYYYGLFSCNIPIIIRCFSAFLAGFLWVYIGFCTMHDGSHYALFNTKTKNIFFNNDVINSVWHGWALWNSAIWYKHHTYGHHSFTGIFGKDPDIIHGRPIFRKNINDSKVLKFLSKIQHKIAILVLFFVPGMYLGQMLAYFIGMFRGHIWKVGIKDAFKNTPLYEKVLYMLSSSILIFNSSYLSVFMYLVALNINYAICIVPDHDTYESTIENDTDTNDWCEMQIRKSANFCEDSKLITELNGGINFQIQHHLFPTVAHCHYEKISPILKSFCKERKIPYVEKKSLMEVYTSYKKMLEHVKY